MSAQLARQVLLIVVWMINLLWVEFNRIIGETMTWPGRSGLLSY